MQAHVLVLGHDAAGLEPAGYIQILRQIARWRVQSRPQVGFIAVGGEGDAIHRTDVHTGVAFDAKLRREHCLHIAIETALRFRKGLRRVKAELDLDLDVLERDGDILERNLVPLIVGDVVVVAPFVDAHLLRHQVHEWRRPLGQVLALAEIVDGNGGVVTVRHRPDDVLGAKCRIAAEKHFWLRRLQRDLVDDGKARLVELDARVPLDPGKRIFLSDRDQHVVAGEMNFRLASRHQLAPALFVLGCRNFFEHDAGEAAVLVRERLWHVVVDDRNAFVHGILFFPRRGFHLLEARAHDHLDVVSAQTARAAAAVHGGIAAAKDDHPLADLVDVTEGHARQPVDADVNILRRLLAAGDIQVASARRAAANHYRVVALTEQCGEAVDARAAPEFDAHIKDVADLLVDHRFRKSKLRDLAADHPARLRVAIVDRALIPERGQVACRRERGGAGADECDPLAVLSKGALRQAVADVVLLVGGDALQAANRYRFGFDVPAFALLHAPAATCRLTRPVTSAAKNSGKDIGLPVDHVGVAVTPSGDQPNVFGNRSMGRTRPLAIDNLVKVIRCRDIRRLQTFSSVAGATRRFAFIRRSGLSKPGSRARRGSRFECREFTPPARW